MNKRKITEQILNVISTAEDMVQLNQSTYFKQNADKINQNLKRVSSAFSDSWLGYHANVYYQDFKVPIPGDRFSPEWGLMSLYGSRGTGNWSEMTYDQVKSVVMADVDKDYEERLNEISQAAKAAFFEAHGSLKLLLAVLIENKSTPMLEEIQKEVTQISGYIEPNKIITHLSPKGTLISRDSTAYSQGTKVPPHVKIDAWYMSQLSPFTGLFKVIQKGNKLRNYMDMHDLIEHKIMVEGSKVFIGHGSSPLWRELQAFLSNRLHLDWDEFNREPTAGLATKERLQAMMDVSCFAFLVMTAEDEHANTTLHARENVVHEVGLFQGKLGFRRAIVLLEKGCSEFSNITGLSQIRFPKGNISAAFEEIRQVLEREGMIPR